MGQASNHDSSTSALARAVRAVGSQAKFARLIGVTQPAVSTMLKRKRPLPPEYVAAVEKHTGISRHDLRPDIYGPAPALLDSPAKFEPAR